MGKVLGNWLTVVFVLGGPFVVDSTLKSRYQLSLSCAAIVTTAAALENICEGIKWREGLFALTGCASRCRLIMSVFRVMPTVPNQRCFLCHF